MAIKKVLPLTSEEYEAILPDIKLQMSRLYSGYLIDFKDDYAESDTERPLPFKDWLRLVLSEDSHWEDFQHFATLLLEEIL